MRPIIFLDIDGVLVTHRSMRAGAGKGYPAKVDQEAVGYLNDLLEKSGAEIVVSSTWRRGRSVADLQALLESWGVRGRVVGRTPALTSGSGLIVTALSRGEEIKSWLEWHPGRPFVILDDESDMGALACRLVKTDFEHGLTGDHVKEALRLLEALDTGKQRAGRLG